jgi:hypothetical protein
MSTSRRILGASATAACALVLLGCIVTLMFSGCAIALAPNDDVMRLPFGAFAGLVLSGMALALLSRGRSLRSLSATEARVVVAVLGLALAALGWAAFGIDSTRPVRELPEAQIVFAASTETYRACRPATGTLLVREGAVLERRYETSARYEDVLDFYRRELESRGWSGGDYFGVTSSVLRLYHWSRDDYAYYLDIPADDLARSGWFRTRVVGPPPSVTR